MQQFYSASYSFPNGICSVAFIARMSIKTLNKINKEGEIAYTKIKYLHMCTLTQLTLQFCPLVI